MTSCYQPLGAVEIRAATAADLPALGDLARRIWRAHYPSIIGSAQTEYMLAQRYSPASLESSHASGEIRFDLLHVDGEFVAYAGHACGDVPGEWKLRQLYVLPEWQGRGLGGRLIRHVEQAALAAGATTLVLTVNRGNERAIASYKRCGFDIRCAADFDIGGGFRMEDFVMTKPLAAPPGSPA